MGRREQFQLSLCDSKTDKIEIEGEGWASRSENRSSRETKPQGDVITNLVDEVVRSSDSLRSLAPDCKSIVCPSPTRTGKSDHSVSSTSTLERTSV